MSNTLAKVKNLNHFIRKHGEDALIGETIAKMLEYKIQQYQKEITRLNREIDRFERTHRMESSDFFKKFLAGNLGDDLDFVEWSALYQMRQNLLEKKGELESI
jgi:bacterioferritin (cytochrome b1)